MTSITGESAIERMPERGGEGWRWMAGLALAAIVSYYTAQTRTESAMSRIEEREQNHYGEVLKQIDLMRQDIRDMRDAPVPRQQRGAR